MAVARALKGWNRCVTREGKTRASTRPSAATRTSCSGQRVRLAPVVWVTQRAGRVAAKGELQTFTHSGTAAELAHAEFFRPSGAGAPSKARRNPSKSRRVSMPSFVVATWGANAGTSSPGAMAAKHDMAARRWVTGAISARRCQSPTDMVAAAPATHAAGAGANRNLDSFMLSLDYAAPQTTSVAKSLGPSPGSCRLDVSGRGFRGPDSVPIRRPRP